VKKIKNESAILKNFLKTQKNLIETSFIFFSGSSSWFLRVQKEKQNYLNESFHMR